MHPPNQRLEKPDKLSQGAHSQTSYPKVQWENTLDKRELQRGKEGIEKEQSGDCEEHRVAAKKTLGYTHAAGS